MKRSRRAALAAAAASLPCWGAATAAPAPATPTASAGEGTPRMLRGLNLTHWFEYERGQAVSAAEMRQLRALGLDHVRLPVDPVVGGWKPESGGRLAYLDELRSAVDDALQAGLEVVLDLHLEPADKQRIEDNPSATEHHLVALWSLLAGTFAGAPREKLAFELFNEPQYYGLKRLRWPPLQRRLLAAVREKAPRHLVLLAAHGGGAFEALTGLATVDDANLAYVFHHYEPFFFTHQGAEWLDQKYTTAGLRRGLRYPPDPADAKAPLLAPHPKAAQELAEYLKSGWGPARMRAEMARVARWARGRGIRVVCNEFGVIRQHVPPDSRYRWITDVRQALEAAGIGWTLWDYTDIFGITAESAQLGKTGRRSIEPAALAALGLKAGTGPR